MVVRPSLFVRALLALAVVTGDLSASDRVSIAQRAYELVQQNFAHWDAAPRANVDASFREYMDRARRAPDRHAFDLASLRFIATLRNGHSQFADALADARPLKFRLLEVEREWTVIFSADRQLPRGAVVRTLGGRRVDDVVTELAQYVAASNDRMARTHVFSNPLLFPERISLGLKTGETVVIDRKASAEGAPAPNRSQGRWIEPGRVAYLRIPSFGDPAFEKTALDFVGEYESAAALIVDVRGNGGGATPGRLIDALQTRPWRTWQQLAPERIQSRTQSPSANAFAGRVFLLVDRFCGSACEDFVMPFKDNHRALLIGEVTQGSSGNPYRADLGHGIRMAIGAVRYAFPDGAPFEGVGIRPDIQIDRRLVDIVNGRDAVLERAQRLVSADTTR